MERGGILKYLVAGFFLVWAVIPFCGMKVNAQPGRVTATGGDTTNMLIYGNNPNRKPPRDGDPVLDVKFVPDSIFIGDLATLRIEVTKDILQIVELPVFEDGKIGDIFEIVSETPPDTIRQDGRKITVRHDITVQTFEDGLLSLGWFPAFYVDKNIADTIWSVDSLVLKVGTFQIDTLTQTIHDIKDIMPAPVKFGEFSGYAFWGLGILAVIALAIWYWFTRRKNLTMLGKPKVIIPPHVVAIKALESLHNQKLWQNSKHKQYYTGITDILRQYMESRYHIPAMEMTSDEILKVLTDRELNEKSYRDLDDILRTADLVKFAKYVPAAEQNENVYTNAYYFVEETKPTEIEQPDTEEGVGI